jgi:hypothetical protein
MLAHRDRLFLDALAKRSIQDAEDRFLDFLFEVSALLIVLGPMEAILTSAESTGDRGMRILYYLGWACPLIGLLFLWIAYRIKRAKE